MDLYPHRRRLKGLLLLLGLGLGAVVYAQPLHVIWDRSGLQDSSGYGQYILPLGDQNGDGYADWVVVASHHTNNTATDTGYVEFFHGGNPPSTQPYATLHTPIAPWGAAGALGDLNGDGYQDWFLKVWTPQHNGYRIQLFLGGPSAPDLPIWTLAVGGPDEFGPVGDFNGDGHADFYWFHFHDDYTEVFFGRSPMDTLPDWTLHSVPLHTGMALPVAFGNLNDDGYSDIVTERPDNYTTYVFLGGADPDTLPDYTWPGAGSLCGVVRDVNGNPYAELVYVAREHAEIHFGGPALHPDPDVVVNFPCSQSVPDHAYSAGDFNHDGYGDFLLRSEYCLDAEWGTVSLYLGHPWLNANPAFTIRGGNEPPALIGIQTAAGLGDINGDGMDDIAIGAFNDNLDIGWRGRAVVIAGDSAWRAGVAEAHPELPQQLQVAVYPNPFNAQATISFVVPRAGGVSVKVFDVTGRLVKILCEERREAGEQAVGFEGKGLSSGVYLVRVQAGEAVARAVKVMLLK